MEPKVKGNPDVLAQLILTPDEEAYLALVIEEFSKRGFALDYHAFQERVRAAVRQRLIHEVVRGTRQGWCNKLRSEGGDIPEVSEAYFQRFVSHTLQPSLPPFPCYLSMFSWFATGRFLAKYPNIKLRKCSPLDPVRASQASRELAQDFEDLLNTVAKDMFDKGLQTYGKKWKYIPKHTKFNMDEIGVTGAFHIGKLAVAVSIVRREFSRLDA